MTSSCLFLPAKEDQPSRRIVMPALAVAVVTVIIMWEKVKTHNKDSLKYTKKAAATAAVFFVYLKSVLGLIKKRPAVIITLIGNKNDGNLTDCVNWHNSYCTAGRMMLL